MSDLDLDDIRQKLLNGTPDPGQYDHSDDTDGDDGSDDTPSPQAATETPEDSPGDDPTDSAPSPSKMNPVLQAYLDDKIQLQQAQAQAKQNQNTSGLTSALVQLTHGISRAPGAADLSGVQAMAKNDNEPITNALARQKVGDEVAKAQDQNDPDSDSSISFRKSLKLVAPKIADAYGDSFDHITAADAPNIMKTVDLKAQIDQRAEAAKGRADAQNANVQLKLDAASGRAEAKSSDEQDKLTKALKTDLDPNGGRAGNMGQNQKRVDSAERLEALINQTGGNPDKRQIEELAIGAQNMLSNGNGSAEQVKALVPQSAWGDANKLYEWFSNNPTGTNQQAFVSRMADTIAREKQIAGDQVKTAQVQRLSAHQALKSKNPDAYNSVLQSYGIDPANIKNGRYQSPAPQQSGSILIRDPKGIVRSVPVDKKGAALAAGGTLVMQ